MTREWYLANRERLIAKSKAYQQANRERIRAYQRNWHAKNIERLKPLLREKSRRQYYKDPEKYARLARESRARLRAEFIQEYGGKCACCGEAEPVFLTLEHKNRDGKAHRMAKGNTPSSLLSDLKRRGWPKDDYELLCFNCNRGSWALGICPHRRKLAPGI